MHHTKYVVNGHGSGSVSCGSVIENPESWADRAMPASHVVWNRAQTVFACDAALGQLNIRSAPWF